MFLKCAGMSVLVLSVFVSVAFSGELYNVGGYEDAGFGKVVDDDMNSVITGSIGGSIGSWNDELCRYYSSPAFDGDRVLRIEAPDDGNAYVGHMLDSNLPGNVDYYYDMMVRVQNNGLSNGTDSGVGYRIAVKYNGDGSGDAMFTLHFLSNGKFAYSKPGTSITQFFCPIREFDEFIRLTIAVNPDPSGDGITTLDRRVRVWADQTLILDLSYEDPAGGSYDYDYCGALMPVWSTTSGVDWNDSSPHTSYAYIDNLIISDSSPLDITTLWDVWGYEEANPGTVSGDHLIRGIFGLTGGDMSEYGLDTLMYYIEVNDVNYVPGSIYEGDKALRLEAQNTGIIFVYNKITGASSYFDESKEYFYDMMVRVPHNALSNGASTSKGLQINQKYYLDGSGDTAFRICFYDNGYIVTFAPSGTGELQTAGTIPDWDKYFRLTYAFNPDPNSDGDTTKDRRLRVWINGELRQDRTYIDDYATYYTTIGSPLFLWQTNSGVIWRHDTRVDGVYAYFDNYRIYTIDTVEGLLAAGLDFKMDGDINSDGVVDFEDFVLLSVEWLGANDPNNQ